MKESVAGWAKKGPEMAEYCNNCKELQDRVDAQYADIVSLEHERTTLRNAISDLMPFVLEDYHENCATPAYRAAVETAKSFLPNAEAESSARSEV